MSWRWIPLVFAVLCLLACNRPKSVPDAIAKLRSVDAGQRRSAADYLRRGGNRVPGEAIRPLFDAFGREPDKKAAGAMMITLGASGAPEIKPHICDALRSGDGDIRRWGDRALHYWMIKNGMIADVPGVPITKYPPEMCDEMVGKMPPALGEPAAAPAAAEPAQSEAIANNPALAETLIAKWTPDASGSIPASTDAAFERELVRSMVYIPASGPIPKHEGKLLVYTDESSFKAMEKTGKPRAIPATELLSDALDQGIGVYVHHEGKSSVFAVFTTDEIQAILSKR